MLLAADETALPAVAGILAWLPAGTRARVWVEVPRAEDTRPLPTAADAEVTWLVREDGRAELVSSTPPLMAEVMMTRVWLGPHHWEYVVGGNGTVAAHRHTLVIENRKTRTITVFVDVTGEGSI